MALVLSAKKGIMDKTKHVPIRQGVNSKIPGFSKTGRFVGTGRLWLPKMGWVVKASKSSAERQKDLALIHHL